jgi:hypothetical protein
VLKKRNAADIWSGMQKDLETPNLIEQAVSTVYVV